MNDERKPTNHPGSPPVNEGQAESQWVLIDDTAPGPPADPTGAESGIASAPAAPLRDEPPPTSERGGWGSIAAATWNGMSAAPPDAILDPETTSGGWSSAGSTFQVGSGSSRRAATDDTGRREFEYTAPSPGLFDDGAYPDDGDECADGTFGVSPRERPPRFGDIVSGSDLVTFAVICVSVVLVISSIVWHPRSP